MNLMLYARSEDAFERDPELAAAYRERQERLRELQELYRTRLGYAQTALRELELRTGDPELLAPERESALEAIRALDEHHLGRVDEVHATFVHRYRPAERPAIERHSREMVAPDREGRGAGDRRRPCRHPDEPHAALRSRQEARRARRSSPGRPARWRSPSASCSSTTRRRRATATPRSSSTASAWRVAWCSFPTPAAAWRSTTAGAWRCSRAASLRRSASRWPTAPGWRSTSAGAPTAVRGAAGIRRAA